MAFCEKCGAKISDDAAFCSGCGNKIKKYGEVEAQNTAVKATTGHESGFRLREVSEESMAQAGINETAFANRVESVDDRSLNDCLFTLYEKLISPVSKIEQLTDAIQNNQYEIEGKKAFKDEKPSFTEYLVRFFISFFVVGIIGGIIYALIVTNVSDKSAVDSAAKMLVLPSMILLTVVPINIKYRISSKITRSRYNKQDIPMLEKEIKDYDDLRNEIVLAIKDYICYCPPAYRNSIALSYFVDSYSNTRVNNLQEAVRAFDEYKRSQDILNALDDICLLLRDIKTQQIRTNEELVSLQASVWGANFLF